jgi:hypothetical protein|nr:MAG TPA: hypothetical protein [Caudoviricetes sp.]
MPDEYISREAAVKIAEKYGLANGSVLGRHTGLADCIASEISALPAADVAPVVRCKDCKYLVDATINANGFLICDISDMEIAPDDFCSYGEAE